MPTLDDAPTIPKLTGSGATAVATDDLIQIYDVSTQKPKTVTFGELYNALVEAGLAEA